MLSTIRASNKIEKKQHSYDSQLCLEWHSVHRECHMWWIHQLIKFSSSTGLAAVCQLCHLSVYCFAPTSGVKIQTRFNKAEEQKKRCIQANKVPSPKSTKGAHVLNADFLVILKWTWVCHLPLPASNYLFFGLVFYRNSMQKSTDGMTAWATENAKAKFDLFSQ